MYNIYFIQRNILFVFNINLYEKLKIVKMPNLKENLRIRPQQLYNFQLFEKKK
jgi:hypothetical protein